MIRDKLICAEELIEAAGVGRKFAYSFHALPFAHLIDGELYYEAAPLLYWLNGCDATSIDEANHNWQRMRETTAGGWEEALVRAEAQREAASAAARRGQRRKGKRSTLRRSSSARTAVS